MLILLTSHTQMQICQEDYLPEASRFAQLEELDWAFGTMGTQDKAKHLATLYLEDISDFMVKTKKEIDKTNLFFALKYSIIPTLLIFIIAFNFKAETFGYLTLSIVFGLTFYTLIKYFSHYQDFKLAKKYKKYVLTLHQHSVFIFLIIFSPLLNIYTRLIDNPEKYQKIITFQSDKPIFIEITFTFMSIYLIIFGVFYSLSAQKNYLKQIEKVKPFLKYL